ncbi:MAG: cytochrome c maturation protein CcmE [Chloroflexi bacterium]|nr:cytochrome c maturation protein CcmE [Chloroflexota bacterium]
MKRKIWFLVIGGVLVVGIIAAATSFIIHNGDRVFQVSDLKAQAKSLQGQYVTVKGQVAAGSINRDDKTQVVQFVLSEGGESINIIYRGILPNEFKPGAGVELQGSYRADGVFEAQSFGRPSSFCAICHG